MSRRGAEEAHSENTLVRIKPVRSLLWMIKQATFPDVILFTD